MKRAFNPQGKIIKPYDEYRTPVNVVRTIARELWRLEVLTPDVQSFIDPSAGGGAWGQAIRPFLNNPYIVGYDIQNLPKPEGYDMWYPETNFLKTQNWGFRLLATNPPFSRDIMMDFLHKCLKSSYHVVLLFRTSFLASKTRYEKLFQHNYHGLKFILHCSRRIQFVGWDGVDHQEHIVVVFERGYRGPVFTEWIGNWDE